MKKALLLLTLTACLDLGLKAPPPELTPATTQGFYDSSLTLLHDGDPKAAMERYCPSRYERKVDTNGTISETTCTAPDGQHQTVVRVRGSTDLMAVAQIFKPMNFKCTQEDLARVTGLPVEYVESPKSTGARHVGFIGKVRFAAACLRDDPQSVTLLVNRHGQD